MNPASPSSQKRFSALLMQWDLSENTRKMPWKGEKDPYRIWLSEIILQQTRVEQGWDYYKRFIKTFPAIHNLAAARDEKVYKLWEGLGYYSRCRNLLHTARYISQELHGKFPDNYEAIRALKGIGPYTAAAISSFAFGLPYAVVDGNVFRVLARVFGISLPGDSSAGKKCFTELAAVLLDKKEPGRYNQAIMDFGAVVCKPVNPDCGACVFKKSCTAFRENRVQELPVKGKKIRIRQRWFYFLVIRYKNKWAIRRRGGNDIWQGLYEFPLVETTAAQPPEYVLKSAEKNKWLKKKMYTVENVSPVYKQQLSHQLINGQFILVRSTAAPGDEWIWSSSAKIGTFAFPRIMHQYLDQLK